MYRKKTIVIITMCIAIFLMVIGYSAFSTSLKINGTGAITSTWRVEFSDIRTIIQKGGATNKVTPSITATTATFEVDLVQPGDEITYEIDITNYGTLNAKINGASYSVSGSEAIYVQIGGIKKGTVISNCSGLTTCPKATMILKVGYDKDITSQPSEVTKTIEITIDTVQSASSVSTEEEELIPELSITPLLLVDQILSDNTIYSDKVASKYVTSSSGIDFSKINTSISSYSQNIPTTTTTVSFSSSSTYYFGTSYTFDTSTGYYKLSGTTTSGTWSSMSSKYATYPYTCKSTSSTGTCATLYKMTGYTDTTNGTGYNYSRIINYAHDNGKGLYYTSTNTEDGKTTYYFRGAVENNYVKFANQIWRIIRINEDGSIRMITQNSVTSMAFNSKNTDNAYVGYMYGTEGSGTYANTHANTNDSDIKKYLDTWYEENLKTNYSSYLADAGFCNDRSMATSANSWGSDDTALGYGENITYYGSYNRLWSHKTPQFKCPQTSDLFTTSTSSKGNKALKYPIGLITADEMSYAGNSSSGGGSHTYYLYNGPIYQGSSYWTMTPLQFGMYGYYLSRAIYIIEYAQPGQIYYEPVSNSRSVRPVINLKADVSIIGGEGTNISPYIIMTN